MPKTKTLRKKVVEKKVPVEQPSQAKEPSLGWYVCPRCKGEGVRIEEDPRRPWIRRKEICQTCGGKRMLRLEKDSPEALKLLSVEQCPQCKNWYAIGGGHPYEETNAPIHDDRSHSHWHDLSFYPPPKGETI